MATKRKTKDKKWIQKAVNPAHKGYCSGKNFGGSKCPKGSKRYNLAKTFKKMAKQRKKK